MAVKKDFTGMQAAAVFDAIAAATAEPETHEAAEMQETLDTQEVTEKQETQRKRKERKTYTEQEARAFMNDMQSTGRKGLHLPRINLAFTPDVYDYIRTMSRAAGMNLTEFTNMIIQQHMEEHRDLYKKAIEFRNSL